MIGKIIKGRGFGGTLAYLLHGSKDKPKAAHETRLIGGNMVGRNARELTTEFGVTRELRPDIKRAVVHIPLSLAPGESFTNTQWRAVTERHLSDLGYDNNQWALVRHSDTDHDHVHIVACSIRFDGTRVNDSMDYQKGALSRQAIEHDYGLKASATTPAEARRAKRRAPAPKNPKKDLETEDQIKCRLRDIVKSAAVNQPTMSTFIKRLEDKGAGILANIAKTGRVSGVSFALEGTVFKGSILGKPYSWQGLQRICGIRYDEDRDFANLKGTSFLCYLDLPILETKPSKEHKSVLMIKEPELSARPKLNNTKALTSDKQQRDIATLGRLASLESQSHKEGASNNATPVEPWMAKYSEEEIQRYLETIEEADKQFKALQAKIRKAKSNPKSARSTSQTATRIDDCPSEEQPFEQVVHASDELIKLSGSKDQPVFTQGLDGLAEEKYQTIDSGSVIQSGHSPEVLKRKNGIEKVISSFKRLGGMVNYSKREIEEEQDPMDEKKTSSRGWSL